MPAVIFISNSFSMAVSNSKNISCYTLSIILTRELVCTGITRARDWLTLVEAKRGVLNEAVTREVMRVSGM